MPSSESRFDVRLHGRRVGTLHQRGDYTRFVLDDDYVEDPQRPVLGLVFEQDLTAVHAAALRLPPWFSNLLQEGVQRRWIATARHVSPDREMELLAEVGHDLPGAVRVVAAGEQAPDLDWDTAPVPRLSTDADDDYRRIKFSLAGVTLKFSMVVAGERLTLPAFGEGGDWIVKLPDSHFSNVPHNEYAMMTLARICGMDVPEVRLVHRDQIDGLPDRLWPSGAMWAYAVRRFDRDENRRLVHIEDLAQVRNSYPDAKYLGNFETVAALVYRRRDLSSLREFSRRLAFNILISNGDAHLKNWSLIYRDPRVPTLAPVYDLVSTAPYLEREDLGLKFGGSRRFERASLATFKLLEQRLRAPGAELAEHAAETARRVREKWSEVSHILEVDPNLRAAIAAGVEQRYRTLLTSSDRS
jgi:serine/threonine-protein kinase HipA